MKYFYCNYVFLINMPDSWFIQLNTLWTLLSILLKGLNIRSLLFPCFLVKTAENCYTFKCIKIPAYHIYLTKTNQFPAPISQSPTIPEYLDVVKDSFHNRDTELNRELVNYLGTQKRTSDWHVTEINAQQLLFNVTFNLVLSWDNAIIGEENVQLYFLF